MNRKFRFSRFEVKKEDEPERFPVFQPHKKALSVEIPRIKKEFNDSEHGIKENKHVRKPPLIVIKHSEIKLNSKSGLNVTLTQKTKPETVKFGVKARKLTTIHLPEINPQLKIDGKSSKLNKIIEDGNYYKLLEFYVKVNLDFTQIFHKIDADKKGYVMVPEVKSYFIGIFPAFFTKVSVFCQLLQSICASDQVNKAEFLATCALVRYEHPAGDAKLSILEVDYQNISNLLQGLQEIYYLIRETPSPKYENVKKKYSGNKEELEKCFKFIFSEPLDFLRFLRVFPIFLWLNE